MPKLVPMLMRGAASVLRVVFNSLLSVACLILLFRSPLWLFALLPDRLRDPDPPDERKSQR